MRSDFARPVKDSPQQRSIMEGNSFERSSEAVVLVTDDPAFDHSVSLFDELDAPVRQLSISQVERNPAILHGTLTILSVDSERRGADEFVRLARKNIGHGILRIVEPWHLHGSSGNLALSNPDTTTFRELLRRELEIIRLRRVSASGERSSSPGAAEARDIINGFSHELRSPLNSIIGFAELLQRQQFGDLNTKQQKYVEYILASARKQLEIVSTIAELTGFEFPEETIHETGFALSDMIEEAIRLIREKAQAHTVRIVTDGEGLNTRLFIPMKPMSHAFYHLIFQELLGVADGGTVMISAANEPGSVAIVLRHEPSRTTVHTTARRSTLAEWRVVFVENVLRRYGGTMELAANSVTEDTAVHLRIAVPPATPGSGIS